mmetsp:Transcript_2511/g.7755  ORF Transcript_2511/g.7755 Transcript_2511/m.7755 type:complete len:252 (-) Transcript_2511:317-1072(-)
MWAKAMRERSARRSRNTGSRPAVRQMMRKVSPMFLLAAPWNSLTIPWTTSAIWFTNFMTLACRTSVAKLKSRIRALPMMHSTRLPGIMALTPELSRPRMLWLTMFAPASPKPRANSEPNLMMVFSRTMVSMVSVLLEAGVIAFTHLSHLAWMRAARVLLLCLKVLYFFISSISKSTSAICKALSGSSAMVLTLYTIRSTGFRTRLLASLEKKSVPMQRTTQMKAVDSRARKDSSRVKGLMSKKKTRCQSSN